MTTSRTNPKVDVWLSQEEKWREASEQLRAIILKFPLTEELKWNKPCYAFQDANVLIIQCFKEYCALMFCKGVLLKDAKGLLVKPGEHTQAGRQLRFTSAGEIASKKAVLKTYIQEAIAAEKAGLEVKFKKAGDFTIPDELRKKLDENAALKTAFKALTPGRQRAYAMYFSAPKQSQTREARIEKAVPQILKGMGLNDDYLRRKKG